MFELLFEKYFRDLEEGNEDSHIYREFLDGMAPEYRNMTPTAHIVRDFIAGMTDEYFLSRCQHYFFPQMRTSSFVASPST